MPPFKTWKLRNGSLVLDRPRIMGILNVTPDSFSDGGHYFDPGKAIDRGMEMVEEGADLIDIGGESTRPGAHPVVPQEEWKRIEPVLESLLAQSNTPLSVDTRQGEVARLALGMGVQIINDISGGQDPTLIESVVQHSAGYVLMHMRGEPQDMMERAQYGNVVEEVVQELQKSISRVLHYGMDPSNLCLDPGFGFAKTPEQNHRLFQGLADLTRMEFPLLVGLSRKRFLREVVGERRSPLVSASTLAAVLAYQKGARVFRVHDVAETVAAFKTFNVLGNQLGSGAPGH